VTGSVLGVFPTTARYKDFIVATSKAYGDAILNEPQIQELVGLYAMISRMRVHSLPRTVACADEIMRATIDTYFAPNKTIRELRELMKSGAGIDPHKGVQRGRPRGAAGGHLAIGRRM
jgi:hypothetical protein